MILEDHTGDLVSVAVTWFNHGPWRASFPGTGKNHYIVAYVNASCNATLRYELRILGTTNADNFFVNQQVLLSCRETWVKHGERCVPSYVIGRDAHDKEVDPFIVVKDSPRKKGICFMLVYVWT